VTNHWIPAPCFRGDKFTPAKLVPAKASSRCRNDRHLHSIVIPAESGIHSYYPHLLRSYDKNSKSGVLLWFQILKESSLHASFWEPKIYNSSQLYLPVLHSTTIVSSVKKGIISVFFRYIVSVLLFFQDKISMWNKFFGPCLILGEHPWSFPGILFVGLVGR